MNRKTLIIAQILISLMMATCMSGVMTLIAMGPSMMWLANWPKMIIIAWPIAFVFGAFISPLAFAIAGRIQGKSH